MNEATYFLENFYNSKQGNKQLIHKTDDIYSEQIIIKQDASFCVSGIENDGICIFKYCTSNKLLKSNTAHQGVRALTI